jgi:thioredoxin
MLRELTVENFEKTLQENPKVVIEFGAKWCVPCRITTPELVKLDQKQDEVKIFSVDADRSSELIQQYEVFNLPTIVLFNKGKEIKRSVGSVPLIKLREFFVQGPAD